ncbi:DUF4337 domain-containing protein [Andreprevotia chitinilytica]|uniref:DUF4337 domain-containing protein n=1 Tax=Andreprevotia chitinilytica TaxID=396808 RepID=UPI0005545A0B|nr:DUF4337 domain-containing protein [Andreprevotia chitinilytica]
MELEVPSRENQSRLNSFVAVSVVILSVCMAFGKIKDANIVQGMQQARSSSIDLWNEYQAKKLKIYIEEGAQSNAQIAARRGDPDAPKQIEVAQQRIGKLSQDADKLMKQARGAEHEYEALDYRHDQFDLTEALFSIAMAVAAMATLTDKFWMLGLSWFFAFGGLVFEVAGFAGWALHPDWIIKFLT